MNEKRLQKDRDLLEWYDAVIFALVLLILVFTFAIRMVTVEGSSMVPTLESGNRILLQSVGYSLQSGDVVVVDDAAAYPKPLVKRVIAKGGDVVDIDFDLGEVSVNGVVLSEPYIAEATRLKEDVDFPITVPQGCLFVMGDNRMHSTDSRSALVGCIDERDILGRVLFRIFPFDEIGAIH